MTNIINQINSEASSLLESSLQSLVQIRSGRGGSGAGTIWHADGLIITCAHVVSRREQNLSVKLADGRSFPARVLAKDASVDLAAITIEASGLPAVTLGDSRLLKPGDWISALGHPWGVKGSATSGVVIGVGDDLEEIGEMWHARRDWIAAHLHLRPGYSGGPMLDSAGRLVGVNSMMTAHDIGIAVPVHTAKAFLQDAMGSKRADAVEVA